MRRGSQMVIDCACSARPRQLLLGDEVIEEVQQQPWVEYSCDYCGVEILIEEENGIYFSNHAQ